MSKSAATVKLEQVTKRFGEFAAVSDLSLAVYPGRIYGLLGPNGAGKTTSVWVLPWHLRDRPAFALAHGRIYRVGILISGNSATVSEVLR